MPHPPSDMEVESVFSSITAEAEAHSKHRKSFPDCDLCRMMDWMRHHKQFSRVYEAVYRNVSPLAFMMDPELKYWIDMLGANFFILGYRLGRVTALDELEPIMPDDANEHPLISQPAKRKKRGR